MTELTDANQIALSKTSEMLEFYRALVAVQHTAIRYVHKAESIEDMKTRAEKATKVLMTMRQNDFIGSEFDCSPPAVWDPVTQTCDYNQ